MFHPVGFARGRTDIRRFGTRSSSSGAIGPKTHKPDNTLLRFLLQHRLPERYGVQRIQKGHPLYEAIAAEVMADYRASLPDEDEVIESINRKLSLMRDRREAIAEHAAREGGHGEE